GCCCATATTSAATKQSSSTSCWRPMHRWPPSTCSRPRSRKSGLHRPCAKVLADGKIGTAWLSTAALPRRSHLPNDCASTCVASSHQPSFHSTPACSKASITASKSLSEWPTDFATQPTSSSRSRMPSPEKRDEPFFSGLDEQSSETQGTPSVPSTIP